MPAWVAGHSLGEFTALVCAGALDFPDAIALVRDRGQFMQQSVPAGTGAMAAILGLEDAAAEAACLEAAQGEIVEAVNYNSPGQIVIAGHATAVARAAAAAKARGAKRAVMLPVSVPAHSALMRGAADQLRGRLAGITLRPPKIPYLSAVDATPYTDAEQIRAQLVRQLASPVRWTATVLALTARGVTMLAECGPGKVLTSLNRRIERRPQINSLALEDEASLQAALLATGSSVEASSGVSTDVQQ
jgi:[acyl-carrier-protein] S-malonyltransferase